MLVGETVQVALTSLRANKLRSALTMLGIIIGVAAVIAMVALGNGAANAVKDRIARLGTTVLQINPQRVQHPYPFMSLAESISSVWKCL